MGTSSVPATASVSALPVLILSLTLHPDAVIAESPTQGQMKCKKMSPLITLVLS